MWDPNAMDRAFRRMAWMAAVLVLVLLGCAVGLGFLIAGAMK